MRAIEFRSASAVRLAAGSEIAVVFVTHDMSLISHFSDRLMVMYAGQVDELGGTGKIFDRPRHPYTKGLLEAFPSIRGPKVPLKGIPGSPPNLAMIPNGCRFHPRCPVAFDLCSTQVPDLYQQDGSLVRCLLYDDAAAGSSSAAGVPFRVGSALSGVIVEPFSGAGKSSA